MQCPDKKMELEWKIHIINPENKEKKEICLVRGSRRENKKVYV
jgi:hypothetical protein